mmetsp:Transcript_23487/g.70579  ORF Transcript_23487/g.70579 Transcript_23487/m.70579 type:complete len:256 (+) Transcript_23487:1066-1833(+)
MFSEFRLYTKIWSRETTWIWARSPSYFHSPVNLFPDKRSDTSEMPFDGLASIGFTGMPKEMWHASAKFAAVRPEARAATRRSKLGISLNAWRTAASMAVIVSSRPAGARPSRTSETAAAPSRAGAVSTKAAAMAWSTVGTWMPMRSLACIIRTMNLASSFLEATSIFLILSFFMVCDWLPFACAIAFISANTFSMVNFGGIMRTFWAMRLMSATSPKSFASPDASVALMWASVFPKDSHMALITVPSPTPSSDSS